jgi:GDP-L-fucose synthase
MELAQQTILLTGGSGFLGTRVRAALAAGGVPGARLHIVRSAEFDLRDPSACARLVSTHFPGVTLVLHCAGFSGGLGANRQFPARFFHDNLVMGANLIHALAESGFPHRGGKFVQVGTMCSYPAEAALPFAEDSLFRGLPDADVAPYGIAKLALLQMLRAYKAQHGLDSAYVPLTNLYGPGDRFDGPFSHAAGAMVKRFVDAADAGLDEVVCWGSGSPTRDFLYVDDAADGLVRAARELGGAEVVNLSSGREVSVRDFAETVAEMAGFGGRIAWDASRPDGVARRCLDASKARAQLGWSARTTLREGLRATIDWYREHRKGP